MDTGKFLRGMLDTAIAAVFLGLVWVNCGQLPGLESQAHAAFGVCRSTQCPDSCSVWTSYSIPEPPFVSWVEDTCNVTAPTTQWSGYCDGICGICALSSRCTGVTVGSGVPCSCVSGGC